MLGFGGSFGASGVKKYATVDDLPLTGVKPGTLAHVEQNLQGVSALYLWNGSQISGGWYKVATVNLAPSIIQGPDASYSLPNDGTAVTLTLVADDPEGLPISWSFSSPDGDLTGSAVIAQNGNVFSISADPALIASQTASSFSLTFKASDGVSLSAATSVFRLSFNVGPANPLTVVKAGSISAEEFNRPMQGTLVLPNVLLVTTDVSGGVVSNVAQTSLPPKLFDVSDPSNPVFLSTLPVDANWLGVSVSRRFATNGMGRVLLTESEGANSTRFFLYDCSDPVAPLLVSSSTTVYRAGIVGGNAHHALIRGAEVSGSRDTRVISLDTGALVADLSHPTFGSYELSNPALPFGYTGSGFVVTRRVGTTSDYRLQHIQLSEAGAITFSHPLLSGPLVQLSNPLSFDGTHCYMLSPARLLEVYDFSVPSAPIKVFTETSANISAVRPRCIVIDGFLYAHTSSNLHVYDVSSPSQPVFLGTNILPFSTVESAGIIGAAAKSIFLHSLSEGGVTDSKLQFLIDA